MRAVLYVREMSPEELTREMQAVRGIGWVVCDWRTRSCRGASAEELEANIEAVNLKGLGGAESPESGGWREISLHEARTIVTYWMRHDLAYGLVVKDSEQQRASVAADRFFGMLTGAIKLYTNSAEPQGGPRGDLLLVDAQDLPHVRSRNRRRRRADGRTGVVRG